MVQLLKAYSICSWIRSMLIGASSVSARGTVLGGRLGCNSAGLGWVRVKGRSAITSLQNIYHICKILNLIKLCDKYILLSLIYIKSAIFRLRKQNVIPVHHHSSFVLIQNPSVKVKNKKLNRTALIKFSCLNCD